MIHSSSNQSCKIWIKGTEWKQRYVIYTCWMLKCSQFMERHLDLSPDIWATLLQPYSCIHKLLCCDWPKYKAVKNIFMSATGTALILYSASIWEDHEVIVFLWSISLNSDGSIGTENEQHKRGETWLKEQGPGQASTQSVVQIKRKIWISLEIRQLGRKYTEPGI